MANDGLGARPSARERFLEAIVQSAIDYAIIAMDLDGLVTSWNEGARRILGWTPEEMIGKPATCFFTQEDRDVGIPEQEMMAALEKGNGNDERWHLRKDGSQFWASGEMMPMRDENEAVVGFIKILRDRTERREQADRQRLLMHELGHRVKNTLAVVQSIATQSLRNAASLEEAARTLQARIGAFSKAHEILLRHDWVSATLAEIVNAAKADLGLDGSDRVTMTGPEVNLGPQAVLSFSLVLHELMTNAFKYGALLNENGRIEIGWRIAPIEGVECLLASWQEIGGPSVKAPEGNGFGSRLIVSSLRAFGDVDLSYEVSGLLLRMALPLAKIQLGTDIDDMEP
jgi:PAS domain S-box-containing protein